MAQKRKNALMQKSHKIAEKLCKAMLLHPWN
jgi:hypothetical protein